MPNRKPLDPTSSPYAYVGATLRDFRERAGLQQGELGRLVHVSTTYISQLETAARRMDAPLVERLDRALKADGKFVEVYRMAVNSERQRPVADYFKFVAELEPKARRIDRYGAGLFPGLLQTPAYASAITRAWNPFRTDEEVDSLVQERLRRAQILDRPERPEFLAVVDEVALRKPIGGPGVMREQLLHVAERIRARQAVVQVLETRSGAHPLLGGQLVIMSFADAPPVAYVETPFTGSVLEASEAVAAAQLAYHLTSAAALPPEASLELIEAVAEEFRP
ncbi:helix-turn-helix domain-containing protein [Streptomyces pactum]|uniref:helix-turn-helix domain-containing protein n=1 Tax=Streptomyces pactum TaxID=68249 RepID=UPI0036FF76EC